MEAYLSKRIVDYDPWSGVTTTFDYDHATDKTYIGEEQDVSLLLDKNATHRNDPDYWRQGVKDCWAHVASIPNIIITKWLYEYGVNVYNKDHAAKVKKLLNSPEYRYLKTTTKMHRG